MPKSKTIFVCSECGYETSRWMGKCPECNTWNAFEERDTIVADKKTRTRNVIVQNNTIAIPLSEVVEEKAPRTKTGNTELDRVLGDGVMKGSVMLFAGDPGIGKSTLLLQVLGNLADSGSKVLYVTGEESAHQIKMRASRVKVSQEAVYILAENAIDHILEQSKILKPEFMVIDSIQTMYRPEHSSAPGSVPQIRECTGALIRYAKSQGVSIFLVGHVTKEGSLAGPRVLEHMVDVVLSFEGDKQHEYRLLRAVKNRFGSVNELGVFQMSENGMESVDNPSESLLSLRAHNTSGSVVFCALQGTRPLLVDIQALATKSFFAVPRRTVNGMDQARISLLLAVIEKRAGKHMYNQDVYINVAGGLSLNDPAADLAVIIAVVSSMMDVKLPNTLSVMGEVGLCGEIRAISQVQRRINECERLGYNVILVPKASKKNIKENNNSTKILFADTVAQALALVLN